MSRAAILGAAAALVAAAPARGAVAILGDRCAGSFCNEVVTYLAEPGENNVFSTRHTSTYSLRTLPVHLDLRPGHPSEDRVSAIPKIDGTPGADVLIGDDGPNELSGGGGRDVVRGMGGNDVLDGDAVDGGDGDDTLDGGLRGGRVRCGPGRDVVIAEPRARVGRDCEVIGYEGNGGARERLRLRQRLRRAGAAFLSGIEPCACKHPERWTVKAGALTVASLRPAKGRSTLRLDAAGRRLLRRSSSLPVRVDLRYLNQFDQVTHVRFRLVLRLA